jgi:PTS system mannose-specific IIB component
VLALITGGLEADKVNVGGMGAKPGTVRLYKNISAMPAQIDVLADLVKRGITVEFQILPSSESIAFDKVLDRLDVPGRE